MKKRDFFKSVPQIIFSESGAAALFASWFIVSFINALWLSRSGIFILSEIKSTSLLFTILSTVLAFALLTSLHHKTKKPIIFFALGAGALLYASVLVLSHQNLYFSLGIIFVLTLVALYLLKEDKLNLSRLTLTAKQVRIIVLLAALFFIGYIGGITIFRYLNYGNSTYDFGIFSQIFYNMKKTGLQNVTCERNGFYSHFHVHFSPIFYLLLPGYMLFPSPIYLQAVQAVLLASAVIPLYLIAAHYKLSNKIIVALCIAFLFYPALGGGCMYDFHENAFLTPLLLWLFYFIEKEKAKLIYLFAALTLMVKEDAFFYIVCIAIYLVFVKKDITLGLILSGVAFFYFALTSFYIDKYGFGIMTDRFSNFISGDGGLFSVLKTVFVNPALVIYESFTKEKFEYLLYMLVPVGFSALFIKKPSRLLLLIPILLMNLMSNYVYQHSITFQYQFGTIAFIFYLVIINLSELKQDTRRVIAAIIPIASVVLFVSALFSFSNNFYRYQKDKKEIAILNSYLEAIPESSSVQASGYFVPKLSNRKVIFDIQYNLEGEKYHETEYAVLDLRSYDRVKNLKYKETLIKKGYEVNVRIDDLLIILKKPS